MVINQSDIGLTVESGTSRSSLCLFLIGLGKLEMYEGSELLDSM